MPRKSCQVSVCLINNKTSGQTVHLFAFLVTELSNYVVEAVDEPRPYLISRCLFL